MRATRARRRAALAGALCLLAAHVAPAAEAPPAQGTRLHFARTLSVQTTPKQKIFAETHRVEEGDSLWRILSRDYRLPEDELSTFVAAFREVNPGVDPDRLAPGQVVRVPFKVELRAGEPDPAAEAESYTVRAGDSVWKILRDRYGVARERMGAALAAVARANPGIPDLDRLLVGQRLAIPAEARPGEEDGSPRLPPPEWHESVLGLLAQLGCRVERKGETFLPLGRGRSARFDAREFPLLTGPSGKKVILDPDERMSAALVDAVQGRWGYRVVRGAARDAETQLDRILPELGFSDLSQGTRVVTLGPGLELLALARWTVVPRARDLWEGNVHLIFPRGSRLDAGLAEAARRAGFRLHTLGTAEPAPPGTPVPPAELAMGDRVAGAASLLAALGVPHRVRPEVDCDLGNGVSYRLRPELTFRYDQVDYAVPPESPARAPSLLSRAGYFTVAWRRDASALNVLGDLLALLGVAHARATVEVPPDQALRLRARGIVLEDPRLVDLVYPGRGDASPGDRLFLTEARLPSQAAGALRNQGLLPWIVRTR